MYLNTALTSLQWFPIDFISCLPFGYVEHFVEVESDDMKNNKAFRLLRMMRLLKLLRLARFKRIFDRWEEQLYSTGGLKMFKLMAVIFTTAHFAACGWYAVGSSADHDVLDLMGNFKQGWAVTQYDMNGGPRNETTLTGRYIVSYYWALMNLCTVDSAIGGDIYPSTVRILTKMQAST